MRIICLLTVIIFGMSTKWSDKLELKVRNAIAKTYDTQAFELKSVSVGSGTELGLQVPIDEHLYTVNSKSSLIGYVYVGEAPSMKNVFDYAVLFSPEMEIVNAKVLIYREKHGRQIGMKRWLKQFFGMSPTDKPVLGEQVDGISGATISAKSMTDAVSDVLESINSLQQNGKL